MRQNDGNNNGQATHGARKPPGPKKLISAKRPNLIITRNGFDIIVN